MSESVRDGGVRRTLTRELIFLKTIKRRKWLRTKKDKKPRLISDSNWKTAGGGGGTAKGCRRRAHVAGPLPWPRLGNAIIAFALASCLQDKQKCSCVFALWRKLGECAFVVISGPDQHTQIRVVSWTLFREIRAVVGRQRRLPRPNALAGFGLDQKFHLGPRRASRRSTGQETQRVCLDSLGLEKGALVASGQEQQLQQQQEELRSQFRRNRVNIPEEEIQQKVHSDLLAERGILGFFHFELWDPLRIPNPEGTNIDSSVKSQEIFGNVVLPCVNFFYG